MLDNQFGCINKLSNPQLVNLYLSHKLPWQVNTFNIEQ